MSEPSVGAGDVEIFLDGKAITLKPSLDACIKISKMGGPGGMNTVAQRLANLDFEMFCDVVTAALAVNPVQAKSVPAAVYNAGMIHLLGPLLTFVRIINHGGTLPDDEESEAGEDAAAPLASE